MCIRVSPTRKKLWQCIWKCTSNVYILVILICRLVHYLWHVITHAKMIVEMDPLNGHFTVFFKRHLTNKIPVISSQYMLVVTGLHSLGEHTGPLCSPKHSLLHCCVISRLRGRNCCPCTTEQTEGARFCPCSGGSVGSRPCSGGSVGLNLYAGQCWSFLSYSTGAWVATLKFAKWDVFIEFTKSIKTPWRL